MKARFATKCKECGNPIAVGAEIGNRNNIWVHAECPKTTVVENNDEDEEFFEMKTPYIPRPIKGAKPCYKCNTIPTGPDRYFDYDEDHELCLKCFEKGMYHQ